ncbi:cytochrome C oxidase assembly protein, putative (macronuclear) [Tetrahymena thermophila SB210]|uniref:Cytochrome C oxidase assembly protein, putative n=1 Tax=Tetrahymena thermophila (strain SB210) TaxID=312017 RepID=Q23M96_TETTS|nr:cytochrome C oxidase assembly protein, putative [Tetrahymena thermophila SB210]EAR97743.1 cytochrome C oxidase assembly protein, putative [Tetrahymena thermophila SB210]|eukprot:XP_001017988.1 cytochrome C oxidase assembly protein, putative [Tetrahymena thermophila SB210]
MKFITIALLALIAVSVNADYEDCIKQLTYPCGANPEPACAAALKYFQSCLVSNSCYQKEKNLSDFSKCVKSCSPNSETEVQNFVQDYADCLNGSIIAYSFVFLAIFAFMF